MQQWRCRDDMIGTFLVFFKENVFALKTKKYLKRTLYKIIWLACIVGQNLLSKGLPPIMNC